jgi:hypothetical protein
MKSIFYEAKDIECCFFDLEQKVFMEPLTPKTLFNKILFIERNRKNENKVLRNHKQGNLWLYNPYIKLSQETFQVLLSANNKLEQIRIDLEKEDLRNMKNALLSKQEALVNEKMRILETFKKKNKPHLYEFLKNDIKNSNCGNLSLPISNLADNLNKCEIKSGELKRISKISKETLRGMDTTIFEIKMLESKNQEQNL